MAAELAQLQQLQGTDPSLTSISVLRLSGDLQVLAEQRAALAREAQSSTKTDVRAQLEAIDAQIKAAAQQRDTALREQLTASDTQTAELRKSMLELFSRQPIPSDVAVDLYRLRQESDNQRKLYESYSQRLGEVQQKINLAIPNSRIVSPAIVPHDPSFPPSRLLLALASILGIGLGGGAAMVREHLVGGFASPEQVEAVTGLPVVASIPNYRGDDPHDAIISHPFSAFAESIRRLRAGIENILGPGRSKIILVTSTEPNEGKSTLAVSLARALATSGYKTLLIDGDLRHPSIRKMTSAPSPAELLELILNVPKGAEITKATGQELPSGLYTIDAAPTKQYASDVLVGTSQFEELLGVVRSFFEYVVIDSPPIGYIVDAKIMSRLADACLYVVKHNATSQRDTLAGLREMREMAHAPPTAIVLNNVQEFLGSYYFRKGKYGSYYEASGE